MQTQKNNNIIRIVLSNIIIKCSLKKLGFLLKKLVDKQCINSTIAQLYFLKCKKAIILKESLISAVARYYILFNNNFFHIEEIKINKSFTLKRSRVRAKGRIDKIEKKYTQITIVLKKNNNHGSES